METLDASFFEATKFKPLAFKFNYRTLRDDVQSQKENRPIYKRVYQAILHIDDTSSLVKEVNEDLLKQFPYIRKAYNKFKEVHEVTEIQGFDLAMWPLLTPEDVATYRELNIFSIEDLLKASQEVLDKGPAASAKHKIAAKAFLSKDTKKENLAMENDELKKEIQYLKTEIKELEFQLSLKET